MYMYVFVRFAGQMLITPNLHPLFVKFGDRFQLTCQSRAGHKLATLRWSRKLRCSGRERMEARPITNGSDGFSISNGDRSLTSELIKNEVRWNDEACYICSSTASTASQQYSYNVPVAVVDSQYKFLPRDAAVLTRSWNS